MNLLYKLRRYRKYLKRLSLLLGAVLLSISIFFHIKLASHPKIPHNTYSHDHIVTDIKFKKCLRVFGCLPEVEPNWFLIPKPLNLYNRESASILRPSSLIFNFYLMVQKNDIKVSNRALTDVSISNAINELPKELIKDINTSNLNNLKSNIDLIVTENGWQEKKIDFLTNGHQKNQVWCKFEKINVKKDHKVFVRDIDVLFGYKDLKDYRPNHKFIDDPINLEFSDFPIHLSLKRKDETNNIKIKPILKTKNNKFKILQLSDLHFSLTKEIDDDVKTLGFVKSAIQKENPNLIILSGDLFDGSNIKDLDSIVLKALSPIIESKIPFAFTFGESDSSSRFNKTEVLNYIMNFPNSYTFNNRFLDNGDKIHGNTNYELEIYRERRYTESEIDLSKPDALVYLLDSENNHIDESQISFIKQEQSKLSLDSNTYKMAFFHFPIPNFRPKGSFKIIGSYNEKHNLQTSTSNKIRDDLATLGINSVSVGHEHLNDACLLSEKLKGGEIENEVWLCYNGVSGFGGYGETDRIVRLFELDFNENRLISWKIRESNGVGYDHQMIARF